MKLIKNNALQGLELYFNTEKGIYRKYLKPKQSIEVPENYVSEQVKNLSKMQLLKISNS